VAGGEGGDDAGFVDGENTVGMMDAITFLKDPALQSVVQKYNDTKREKGAVAFNLLNAKK
jgi:hypothetical protein